MYNFTESTAETSVIGAILSDSRTHVQAQRLTPDDFVDKNNRAIFGAVQQLMAEKKPVDLVTVGERLNYDTELLQTMTDAVRLTPITVNCSTYVDLVLDASVRRKSSQIGEALYRAMGNRDVPAMESIADARAKLADISGSTASGWMSSADVVMRTYTELEQRVAGGIKPVLSGISALDYLTGGFFPGEMTIIGAKPGVGKSVLGMMIAMNADKAGRKSGICSLEMLDTQYGQRLLSSASGVDGMKLRKAEGITDDDWVQLGEAASLLGRLPTAYTFDTRYIEDLALAVRNRIDRDGLDILVVDYLQLMRTHQRTENERLTIAAISWALKTLSTECRIPVIALAQLRRPGQGEANKMPTMRDLRESGNLEADADNIILMHEPENRDDPYVYKDDKTLFDAVKTNGGRYIALKVEKQRQGATGVVSVIFRPNRMEYQQIERTGAKQ